MSPSSAWPVRLGFRIHRLLGAGGLLGVDRSFQLLFMVIIGGIGSTTAFLRRGLTVIPCSISQPVPPALGRRPGIGRSIAGAGVARRAMVFGASSSVFIVERNRPGCSGPPSRNCGCGLPALIPLRFAFFPVLQPPTGETHHEASSTASATAVAAVGPAAGLASDAAFAQAKEQFFSSLVCTAPPFMRPMTHSRERFAD